MKHTPGPWKVHHHSHINHEQWLSVLNGAFDISHNGAGNPAVVACSRFSAMGDEENLANAKLIAAAPELLETMQSLIEISHRIKWHPDETELWAAAEEAIRKATE